MHSYSGPWKTASHSIWASQDCDTNSIYAREAMLSSSTISHTQLGQPIISDTQTTTFWGWERYQVNPHPASQLIWPRWWGGWLQQHMLLGDGLQKRWTSCFIIQTLIHSRMTVYDRDHMIVLKLDFVITDGKWMLTLHNFASNNFNVFYFGWLFTVFIQGNYFVSTSFLSYV